MLRSELCPCRWLPAILLPFLPILSANAEKIVPYSGCGTIGLGVECPHFVGDDGASFSLPQAGDFTVGDRVFVSGTICFDCPSICQQGPVFETAQIGPCNVIPPHLDACGTLVQDLVGSALCTTFEDSDGNRWALQDLGAFKPGDHLHISGDIMPCDSLCKVMGCVNNDPPTGCIGDVNNDGRLDVDDLLVVIAEWGPCSPPCGADANQDGVVNVDDLLMVIVNWSPTVP